MSGLDLAVFCHDNCSHVFVGLMLDIVECICYKVGMYIARVPNRNSPPAYLLRESYRENGKVKNRTLANLSKLPPEQIELLRRVLKGEALLGVDDALEIAASLPHGHVAAVVGTLKKLGVPALLDRRRSPERQRVLAMIAARVLAPGSKLATARGLGEEAATSTLGESLALGSLDADDLYDAMDWLLSRQAHIESELARRHLGSGVLVLYDVTSTYFEGRTCPLAQFGYSRDGKRGKLQILVGLLCDRDGRPVAVEVFDGNTGDPSTLSVQIEKLQQRFGLERVVFVGDRGMVTSARIREELRPAGLDWISALRSPQIKGLVASGTVQPSLFDEQDLAEITHEDYPGERLIACFNPLLARERARKREALLIDTEAKLERIRKATMRTTRPLRGQDEIGVRVGRVLEKSKVGKHFLFEIDDDRFEYRRHEARITEEARLDGIYIVRTSLSDEDMDPEQVVDAYKSLARVERAFRRIKTVDLKLRPIYHRLENRVRAHVLICMLAYYVEWHMRQSLAPLLFEDEDPAGAKARRQSPVERARRSEGAERKTRMKKSDDGHELHSFQGLLAHLAALGKCRVRLAGGQPFWKLATPTPLQQRAFELLEITLV